MFSGLALTAAACLLSWRMIAVARAKGRIVGGGDILLAAMIPAAFLCLCLVFANVADRMDELRLTLCNDARCSIQADLNNGPPFSVGGDREDDDLIIDGLGQGVLTVEATSDGKATADGEAEPALKAKVTPARTGEAPFVVGVGRARDLHYLGETPISNGDAVCLSRCGSREAQWFVLQGRRFLAATVADGKVTPADDAAAGPEMPMRLVMRAIPGIAFWTANQTIHPLRDHLPPAMGLKGAGGCGTRYFCARAGSAPVAPVASFLFRDGGLMGGRLRLAMLDSDARFARGGVLADALSPEKPELTLANGASRALSVWEVRYAATAPNDPDAVLSRLVERRSFSLRNTKGVAAVRVDSPEVLVIGGCNGNEVRAVRTIGDPTISLDGAISFKALGGRLARSADGVLPLPDRTCRAFRSAAVALGDRDSEQRAVEVRLDHLSLPWPLAIVAIFWAIISWRVQSRVLGNDRIGWILISTLQMLLALRLLIALAGAYADPKLNWRALLIEPALAYVLAPGVLLLTAAPLKTRASDFVTLGVFAAAAVASQIAWLGQPAAFAKLWIALFAALLGLRLILAVKPDLVDAASGLLDRLRASGVGLANAVPKAVPWVWWMLAAVALRGGLGLLGFKERIGVAVSALYTPLLIMGFAGLFAAVQTADEPNRRRLFFVFGGALVLLCLALPFWVHDVGYAMVIAPLTAIPAAYALSAPAGRYSRLCRFAWTAPAAAVLLGLLAILAMGAMLNFGISDKDIRTAATAPSDAAAISLLERQAGLDQNALRLSALAMPEALATAGTTEAENLRAWSAHLSSYTSEWFGRGYMAPSRLSPILARVQMDDNVSAIHLMSPFGRVGAAAFLLLLAATAIACASATDPGGAEARPAHQIAGLIALWLMFGVGAYCILANLQLTPFTGRNVYLLAPASSSDLLEGLTLFAFAYWGLARRREPA